LDNPGKRNQRHGFVVPDFVELGHFANKLKNHIRIEMKVNPDVSVLERTTEEWAHIVSVLQQKAPHLIQTRSTDHEYRTDDRDIVIWKGKKVWYPIDSLAHNVEQDKIFLQELLYNYFEVAR
jgi:hypothetical protein